MHFFNTTVLSVWRRSEDKPKNGTVHGILLGLNCLHEFERSNNKFMKLIGQIWRQIQGISSHLYPWAQWQAGKESKPLMFVEKQELLSWIQPISSLSLFWLWGRFFKCLQMLAYFGPFFYVASEESVWLSVVKTQLCLHRAGPNHTRRGS